MTEYRLLVFSENRLVRTENIEADGHVEAIKACSERHRSERMELWSDDGRVAVLGMVSNHHAPR